MWIFWPRQNRGAALDDFWRDARLRSRKRWRPLRRLRRRQAASLAGKKSQSVNQRSQRCAHQDKPDSIESGLLRRLLSGHITEYEIDSQQAQRQVYEEDPPPSSVGRDEAPDPITGATRAGQTI